MKTPKATPGFVANINCTLLPVTKINQETYDIAHSLTQSVDSGLKKMEEQQINRLILIATLAGAKGETMEVFFSPQDTIHIWNSLPNAMLLRAETNHELNASR